MSTEYKKIKPFSREEGLFEIRDNQNKGCLLHLAEYVLQNKFL